MGCKTILTGEPSYSLKPNDIYDLTVPELINLAHKLISNMYIRGNRNMYIPEMAEKQDAKQVERQQKEQLDDMVHNTWDVMFPEVN